MSRRGVSAAAGWGNVGWGTRRCLSAAGWAGAAFAVYSNLVDAQWRFYFSSNSKDASFTDVSIGATNLSYAIQLGSREAALVGGALASGGQMSAAARQQFTTSVAIRRSLMSEGIAGLTPDLAAPYTALESTQQYRQFQAMEDEIMASPAGRPVPVSPANWQQASGSYLAGIGKAELDSGTKLGAMSNSLANRLVLEAILAGGLGLLAVIGSIFLIGWFGRKVTRDMTGLNDSVRGMADERLPRVVERLRRGEDVDVAAESPPPPVSTITEISRIAESFATVQAAAVTAAVDQAKLRKGVNQVFLNISMRNQSLLHRQLGMLDSMERRTSEPEALADLFRIDHLTTRMRRHAEGLIILSGSVPGRGLGLSATELADINQRLARTPEFDLDRSDQLGLYGVSQLATRHDIQVSLRRSVYGGTTAVVLLPFGVIVREEEAPPVRTDQGEWISDSGRALTGRHRLPAPARMLDLGTRSGPDLRNGPDTRNGLDTRNGEWPATAAPSGPSAGSSSRAAVPPAAPLAPWEIGPPPTPPTAARPVSSGPPWDTEATDSWPAITPDDSGSREPAEAAAAPDSHLGMPIRVPQASLAPQLRGQRDAAQRDTAQPKTQPWAPFGTDHEAPEVTPRSPEATRNMLSLMQQGWRRGRVDDLDHPDGAPGNGTDR